MSAMSTDSYVKTEALAYDEALAYLDEGYLPACVLVHDGRDQGVYTTVLNKKIGNTSDRSDLEVFAAALLACDFARRESEMLGLRPVD